MAQNNNDPRGMTMALKGAKDEVEAPSLKAVVDLGTPVNVQELSPEDRKMIEGFSEYFIKCKVEEIQAERVRELAEAQDKP